MIRDYLYAKLNIGKSPGKEILRRLVILKSNILRNEENFPNVWYVANSVVLTT